MSRGKHPFKKTDLARGIQGVREQGLTVRCVRFTADGFEVEIETAPPMAPLNNLDVELQEFEARRGSR
jgi:hypothetical protein